MASNLSLRRNIAANYASQIYATLISILMVPMYLRYMGAEAYGLVGFFAMLQAWFQLLDMGLTPTMARETARFNGGATDALSLRRLFRAMEGVFIAIAILGGAAMMAGSGAIAGSWLKVHQLSIVDVQHSIKLMAAIIALRLVCGLYRGAINGFERLVWLSGFNIAIATARFVLIIPYFMYVGTSPAQFFSYQLALAVIEVIVLGVQTYRLLPAVVEGTRKSWQWAPFRSVLKFSLSVAFTGSVWVLVTQTDKLILSKLLSLSDYAYFSLAVLVAGGVGVISGPISAALLPRMSKLAAEGDDAGVIRLYRNATQLVGVIAIPATLVLTFFAEQVLWAWTGDADVTQNSSAVLRLYALGNGVLAIGAFPYYLQFAKGDLRLHMIGNAFFVVLLIPILILATLFYGVVGAGCAWLGVNVAYFLIWVPKVHARLVKGLHAKWIRRDVGLISLLSVLGAVLANGVVIWPREREQVALYIVILSVVLIFVAAMGSSVIRGAIVAKWRLRQSQ